MISLLATAEVHTAYAAESLLSSMVWFGLGCFTMWVRCKYRESHPHRQKGRPDDHS